MHQCPVTYNTNPANLVINAPTVTTLLPTDQFLFLRGDVLYKVPLTNLAQYINPGPLVQVPIIPPGLLPTTGAQLNSIVLNASQIIASNGGDPPDTAPNQTSDNFLWNVGTPAIFGMELTGSTTTTTVGTSLDNGSASQVVPLPTDPVILKITVTNSSLLPGDTVIVDNLIFTDTNGISREIPSFNVTTGSSQTRYFDVEGIASNSTVKGSVTPSYTTVTSDKMVEFVYYG